MPGTNTSSSSDFPLTQSYFKGAEGVPLTNATLGEHFRSIVDKHPDQEAIVVRHQAIRWTYRELWQQVEKVATGLLALGVRSGDRVGIWSPNSIEWSLVQYATARIGAVMVCLNPAYRPHELEFAINNVGVKYLVMAESFKQSDYVQMIQELADEPNEAADTLTFSRLPSLKQVILTSPTPQAGMLPFSALYELGTAAQYTALQAIEATLKASDPINIQFTSGTTGNPKGATLSHYNILNNGHLVAHTMRLTQQDKICIPVPLYHCFGMVLGNLVCMSVGACAVFPSAAFDPALTLQTVQEEKCTGLHGVPTMFIAELELADFDQYDLRSLRTGVMAGSTCPEELMRKVHQLFHMHQVVIGYGQTECSPINHITDIDSPLEKQVKTVGRAMDHTEVKIVDSQGNIAPLGEPGEICARGYCVMQGYWDDAAKTQATIDEHGWLHSGDLGVMDEEGYVTIVGRIKDMIIRGGENIYPREIEELLYHHEDISDAAVFGIPDDKFGEQVCLWLTVKDGRATTEQAIKAYLQEHLAYFKIPKYIRIVDSYPMTVTGKVQKFKMREQMVASLEEQSALAG